MPSDYHGETYIVKVEREDGRTQAEVRRVDGDFYKENFVPVGEGSPLEIGGIIDSDFEHRRSVDA